MGPVTFVFADQALLHCRENKIPCLLSVCHCSTISVKNREKFKTMFYDSEHIYKPGPFLNKKNCFEV